MWTRSAANKETGLMTVECYDWNGNLFFKGEFAGLQEAEAAGVDAERRMTQKMTLGDEMPTLDEIFAEMDDDELLAELCA